MHIRSQFPAYYRYPCIHLEKKLLSSFSQTRNASLVTIDESKDKNKRGTKQNKQRITLLRGSFMSGEKLPSIVIGKYKSPRGFNNSRTPLDYYSTPSAWMTSEVFEKLLRKFDRTMGIKNRKVILFIDNCSAHNKKVELQNVQVQYFPPNVTSKCQPLDMGIIASFKNQYKTEVEKRKVQALNVGLVAPKINLFESLFIVKKSWFSKVTDTTIQNSFRKAGFKIQTDVEEISDLDAQEDEENLIFNDDLCSTSTQGTNEISISEDECEEEQNDDNISGAVHR